MKQQNYVDLFFKILFYDLAPQSIRKRIREKRLKNILNYARKKTPYYRRLYADLPAELSLKELPSINKSTMMTHYDEFLAVNDVTHEDVEAFITDINNVPVLFKNKYAIARTSGSTGYPATYIMDKTGQNLSAMLTQMRTEHFRYPLVNISTAADFCLTNVMMHQAIHNLPCSEHLLKIVDARQSLEEMVRELNDFQPKIVGGYCNSLVILADEQAAGRLKIKPKMIAVSGEYLKPALKDYIAKIFHCQVRMLYACTEGGMIAYECRCGHLHIHDDWIILEPVDSNNQPVPDGVLSDKVLLTCLYDYTQPKIRYEVTDRVIMHHEPCICGSKKPWIEVEGRLIDILIFEEEGREIQISPQALPLDGMPGVKYFQFILHPKNRIELRVVYLPGYDPEKMQKKITKEIKTLLNENGIFTYDLQFVKRAPEVDQKTGKFRQVYQVDDE